MVAKAVEQFTFRIPLCTAKPLLMAADDAASRGEEVKAAVLLREAVRKYLEAWCEHRAIKIHRKRRTPAALLKALRQDGYDVCRLVDEIIECCNAVCHCAKPECSIPECIDLVFTIFGNDFSRNEGGAL